MTQSLSLDPYAFPLSRYGSYLIVSSTWGKGPSWGMENGWTLRWIRDNDNSFIAMIHILENGERVEVQAERELATLKFTTPSGAWAEFVPSGDQGLRIRTQGCALEIATITGSYSYAYALSEQYIELIAAAAMPRIGVTALSGDLHLENIWESDDTKEAQCSSISITSQKGNHEYFFQLFDDRPQSQHPATESFEEDTQIIEKDFEQWASAFKKFGQSKEYNRSIYTLWLNSISAYREYPSDIILGSKNWMQRIWSWDHCFNALALAEAHPKLAWEQFILMKNMQGPSGMLCDTLTPWGRTWTCTKNPIHGWTFKMMRQKMKLSKGQLEEAYSTLKSLSTFWTEYRSFDETGLPYIVYPNESFDNTTHTATEAPCIAPDICTYVILLLDELSELAEILGLDADSKSYLQQSKNLLERMIQYLWNGKKFLSLRLGDHYSPDGDSIFNKIPLLLGRRLPEPIIHSLLNDLMDESKFWSPWGFRTEAKDSPKYDPDTYVRGRVWMPPNYFIAEALSLLGKDDLAIQIKEAFTSCIDHSGPYECFHPETGEGLEDPAYNWTAAARIFMNPK